MNISKVSSLLFFLLMSICQCSNVSASRNNPTPIVLWHGMGDSCCFSFSLGKIKEVLEDEIPGVYVKSVRIGNNNIEDVMSSYFKNVNEQVSDVCEDLKTDYRLKDGYNAIGFSQGGQFLRAVSQRCPFPQMKNLISLGGQHQGIYGLPNCDSIQHPFCDYVRRILNTGAYTKRIQYQSVQAEYWHDPLQEQKYKQKNIFLADINNELTINETYKKNLQQLNKFVLVLFNNDTMVDPRETEWFGFYKSGQAVEKETLQESKLYREDRLGLKKMDKAGKLDFLSLEGNHLEFSDHWFKETIIQKYLL